MWADSNIDTGRIASSETIKIPVDMITPLAKLLQYPLQPEATPALTPTAEAQGDYSLYQPLQHTDFASQET